MRHGDVAQSCRHRTDWNVQQWWEPVLPASVYRTQRTLSQWCGRATRPVRRHRNRPSSWLWSPTRRRPGCFWCWILERAVRRSTVHWSRWEHIRTTSAWTSPDRKSWPWTSRSKPKVLKSKLYMGFTDVWDPSSAKMLCHMCRVNNKHLFLWRCLKL